MVSKPHLECIERICNEFVEYKEQILFRFTIGSHHDEILKFWEPNAPAYHERQTALATAFVEGYKTSVSCEPLLEPVAVGLFNRLKPMITDSIWFGGMNKMDQRVDTTGWTEKDFSFAYKAWEAKAPGQVKKYYEALKDEPKVRFKDSFKKILGIPSPERIGLDI